MSEHTKGEWSLSSNGLAICSYIGEKATYMPIAKMQYKNWMENDKNYLMSRKTAEANARLIAAAPDLLAACEDAIATYGRFNIRGQTRLKVEEAIAKAKG